MTMTAFSRRLALALALLAAVPAMAQEHSFYVVQTGDTLFRVARAHGLSVAELRALNGLDGDVIRVGQRLLVRPLEGAPPRPPQGAELPAPPPSAPPPSTPPDPLAGDAYANAPADVGQTDDRQEGLIPPDPIPAGPPPPPPPPATITRVAIGGTNSGQVVAGGASGGGEAQVHVVERGETLFTIAQRYGMTVADLRARNGLSGDLISVGQRLAVSGGARPAAPVRPSGRRYDVRRSTLPDDQVHVVRPGQTLFDVAVRYGASVGELLTLNPDLTSAPLEAGAVLALPAEAARYYREPAPLPEPDETGLALVYPDSYVGRETISGEPYDPAVLTASHRTLPFGTILLVTMPSTGRSTLVRVNDRGPVSEGFLVELSEAAAVALGQNRGAATEIELRVVR
jgi:LysM repeat protein